eukprot:3419476-Prymnesium_polylepis.1
MANNLQNDVASWSLRCTSAWRETERGRNSMSRQQIVAFSLLAAGGAQAFGPILAPALRHHRPPSLTIRLLDEPEPEAVPPLEATDLPVAVAAVSLLAAKQATGALRGVASILARRRVEREQREQREAEARAAAEAAARAQSDQEQGTRYAVALAATVLISLASSLASSTFTSAPGRILSAPQPLASTEVLPFEAIGPRDTASLRVEPPPEPIPAPSDLDIGPAQVEAATSPAAPAVALADTADPDSPSPS